MYGAYSPLVFIRYTHVPPCPMINNRLVGYDLGEKPITVARKNLLHNFCSPSASLLKGIVSFDVIQSLVSGISTVSLVWCAEDQH